jgi:molybdopterin-guanine dinucleotide biosynthesis protein A
VSATARVGAVVLAGGRSSRFGRDKLVEPIDGRPMLDHAIDAVLRLTSDVVVVLAPDAEDPALPSGVRTVRDIAAFEGPLAGLSTGLRALGQLDASIERAIVVGGDMPTLIPAVLERLLAELEVHEFAVLSDGDRPRPLPMAVRRVTASAAAERLLETGERRLRALMEAIETSVLAPAVWRVDDPSGATLRDVDVPGDLPG